MYFSLKNDCYFRRYGEIGYITRPNAKIDQVLNLTGALFLEKLDYIPKRLEDIIERLMDDFDDINANELKEDVTDFYLNLSKQGFLNYKVQYCEETDELCKDILSNDEIGSFILKKIQSTNRFLINYLKEHPFLESFQIEITSRCNERCVHCYIPHEVKNSDIDYNLMMDVLEQCNKMNVLSITLSGGEPLLHPNFVEFLKRAKDLDFNVSVLTNLMLLTDQIIEALLYRHPSYVCVSLYSMNHEVHDSITKVPGSWRKTIANILKLIEHNVPVRINCPVMKQNMDDFDEVIRWGRDKKCDIATDYLIVACSDQNTENLKNRLSERELEIVLNKLLNSDTVIQSSIKRRGSIDNETFALPEDIVCGVGISTLSMVSNGDVFPCAGWHTVLCGNLYKTELQEIWNNSPQVNYLRAIRVKDFPKCLSCDDWNYCNLCMCRNANEDQDGNIFNVPKIACDAAKAYHKLAKGYKERLEE